MTESVALVTGANKGIGYEIARGLCAAGVHVVLGCRDEQRGRIAEKRLIGQSYSAESVMLDVTNAATIADAAAQITGEHGRLDILVNNAGIEIEGTAAPSAVPLEIVRRIYETNVFGAIAVTQAMTPLLRKANAGRVVNMSTGLASLAGLADFSGDPERPLLLAYASSKSALNAVTLHFAREFLATPIKVNAVTPGLCATDMTRGRGRPARAGSVKAIELALIGEDGPTGKFFDDSGEVPW